MWTQLLQMKTRPQAQVKKGIKACNPGLFAFKTQGPIHDRALSPFVPCIENRCPKILQEKNAK